MLKPWHFLVLYLDKEILQSLEYHFNSAYLLNVLTLHCAKYHFTFMFRPCFSCVDDFHKVK